MAEVMPIISEKNQQECVGGTGSILGAVWNATADGTNATYTNMGSGSFTDGTGFYNYGSDETLGDNFYYDSGSGSGFESGEFSNSTNFDCADKGSIFNNYNSQSSNLYAGAMNTFSNTGSAFKSAALYSSINQKECSGLVSSDGTAVVYSSSYATRGGTDYPEGSYTDFNGKTYYCGKEIVQTFHTHFNSCGYSETDNTTQSTSYPNAT